MNLGLYYEFMFSLAQSYGSSIEYVEGLMPYERDLYYEMLIAKIEKQK